MYSVKYIKESAEQLNLTIPEPLCYTRFLESGWRLPKDILLDDADVILSRIFKADIHALTMSTPRVITKGEIRAKFGCSDFIIED